MVKAKPAVAQLRGLWRRSMFARPDGTCDTTTTVRWLQGLRSYVDLRQPAQGRDFSAVRALADLSRDDCSWLATQEGFAGYFGCDGGWFEWQRAIDFQPRTQYPDVGSLEWDGEELIEKGRDVAYVEHWRRESGAVAPAAALVLRQTHGQTRALLLRVGAVFMFARERVVAPQIPGTLSACVAAADSVQLAQQLVDCEISFGTVSAGSFQITASSLPYRIGDVMHQRLASSQSLTTMDRAINGDAITRPWDIVDREGEVGVLDATAGL
jgi:hypothetical protein